MEELLYDLMSTPEERAAESAEREAVRQELTAQAAERMRREEVWKARHPAEWVEWVRVRLLLNGPLPFGDVPFDFDDFLKEVGRAPSPAHRVVRKTKVLPFQQGNLLWKEKSKSKTNPSPSRLAPATATQAARDFLTKQEVAVRLQVSTRTVCRWRSVGLLKEFRRGQVLRFKREDVEAFEAKGRSGRR